MRVQATGVVDGAAGDDETHGDEPTRGIRPRRLVA